MQALTRTDLASKTIDELQAILKEDFRLTTASIVRIAIVAAELESRGVKVGDLPFVRMDLLRMLAAGTLCAEAMLRFIGRPMLLDCVRSLPIDQQCRLAAGDPVPLIVWKPDGKGTDKRMADPVNLDRAQLSQVFSPAGIRDEGAQIAILEAKRLQPQKRSSPVRNGVYADHKTGTVRIGKKSVQVVDLVDVIGDLRSGEDEDDGGEKTSVSVSLTEHRMKRLRTKAAECGCSVQAMIIKALKAAAMI